MNAISSLLKFIGNKMQAKTVTASISKTGGSTTLNSASFIVKNDVVMVKLIFNGGFDIAAGEDFFVGVLNTSSLLPIEEARLSGYYGQRALSGFISKKGEIKGRNASTLAISSSSTADIVLNSTYVIK